MTAISSNCCEEAHIGSLFSKKIDEAVLLSVLRRYSQSHPPYQRSNSNNSPSIHQPFLFLAWFVHMSWVVFQPIVLHPVE